MLYVIYSTMGEAVLLILHEAKLDVVRIVLHPSPMYFCMSLLLCNHGVGFFLKLQSQERMMQD